MILLLKHGLLFSFYFTLCFMMVSDIVPYSKGLYYSFFPVMMIYYLAMLSPKIQRYYIYQVMERRFVRWKVVWQLLFHSSLSLYNPTLCIATILYMYLLKDFCFLINFAETRLAKIEETIHEKMPQYRIAHLHLNVFEDDMDNRFHVNCYHTNRLYLLESTVKSRKTQLGISNYRDIRRRKQNPRTMNEEEEKMYIASSNNGILLANRNYLQAYYIGSILIVSLFIDLSNTTKSYVNLMLIFGNIFTYLFTHPLFHDGVVDISYAVVALFVALEQSSNI